jgi:hypothetical protein
MATGFNRMSAINIGGTYTNTINSSPYGNTSFDVSGNAIFRNNVVVLGNIINSGVSGPTGSVNFNNLNITDNLTVGNQLGVTGPTELYTTLNVGGTATFVGPVGITGDCSIYGNQYTNNTNVGGILGVTGTTNLYSNTNVGGILGVTGNTNLYGTLYVNGNAEFNNQVKTDILTSTAAATATYIQPTGDLFLYNAGGLIPSRPANNIFMNSSFNIAVDAGNNITNNLDGDYTINNGVADKGLIIKNTTSTASSNILFKDSINVETAFIKSYPSSAGAIQDTLDISAKAGTMRLFSGNIISNSPLSIISATSNPFLEFKNTSGSGSKRIMFRDSLDVESLNIQSSGTLSSILSDVPLEIYSSGTGSYMNFASADNMGFDAQGTCNFISRAGTISFEAQGGPIIFNNSGVTGASGDMELTSGNVTTIQSTKQTYIKTTDTTDGNIFIQPATNRNVSIETTGTGKISLNTGTVEVSATANFTFIPVGTINTSVVSTVPSGFLYCNGQAVSRTTYARLFSAINTTFGAGNGSTTFNVPNFQGAFIRGAGNQTVGGVTYTAAAIGTAQQDQVLQTTVYATNEGFRDCSAGTRECVARRRITADPVDTDTGILPQFQRQGTENRPMNYAVYYYIKF